MKKDITDKIRSLINTHNKGLSQELKIKELSAKVTTRIGFNNKEQIIVTYS